MPRLFIALPIESDLKENLSGIKEILAGHKNTLKIVEPDNYHITVKFLGECTDDLAEKIVNSFLKIECPGDEISFTASGIGVFPNLKMPSVIWAGLRMSGEKINSLYCQIEDMASRLGFEKEKRGFSPHLTLARVRKGKKISDDLRNLIISRRETRIGESSFKRLVLFSSNLTPEGPVYTEVESLPFVS